MRGEGRAGLQALIFFLVSSAFLTIYITQPVLPVIRSEFGVSESYASLTVSAVIFGIALATLPFGMLADTFPVRPILFTGGSVVIAGSVFCAFTGSLPLLVAARFLQGLFIPSITTCLVVYLVRSLPLRSLNVVMGSYVSATVAGGLGGRLLGGWIHSPFHWRYAFLTASVLLCCAILAAAFLLPGEEGEPPPREDAGFLSLLSRRELLRTYFVAFCAFFVFSSIFNYLPFYLAAPPFRASTRVITFLYLSYLLGVAVGPPAGTLCDRIGNGATIAAGSAVFAAAILATFVRSTAVVMASLAFVCAGFFTVHAAAAGSLNRRLAAGRGRANSLYVLFYYLGGSIGITVCGRAYGYGGWRLVAAIGILMLCLTFAAGVAEMRAERGIAAAGREGQGPAPSRSRRDESA